MPWTVAVHEDGSFECVGGCDGVRTAYHDDDAPAPCSNESMLWVARGCARCQGVKPVQGGDSGMSGIAACSGTSVDHEDGTTTCSLDDDCTGPELLHASGMSCSLLATPCIHCAS